MKIAHTGQPKKNKDMTPSFILNKLYTLLRLQNNLDGIFFIENSNSLSISNDKGKISVSVGNENTFKELIGKDIYYSHVTGIIKAESISKARYEVKVNVKDDKILKFNDDKTLLVCPISTKIHHWGYLLIVKPNYIEWTAEQISIIDSFEDLLADNLVSLSKHRAENHYMKEMKVKLIEQSKTIDKLRACLSEKKESILQLQEDCHQKEAVLQWTGQDKNYDEVWISLQAYNKNSIDPTVSRWGKVTNQKLIDELENLLGSPKRSKKVV